MGKSGNTSVMVILVGTITCMILYYLFFGYTSKMVSNGNELDQAKQAFKELPRFKGKKINLYKTISFYDDGRIYLTVQDPDTPSHINGYQYHLHKAGGRWTNDGPYKLDHTDYPLQNGLFPLDSFSFSTAAKIVTAYNAKARTVGSNETLDMVEYDHYFAGRGNWNYEEKINGGTNREGVEYKILFKDDGSIKYFGEPNGWNMINDSAEIAYAEKTLKNLPQFKGKKLRFKKEIDFNSNNIYLTLQNPDTLQQLINYEFHEGEVWQRELPDDADDGKINHLFPLDSVPFIRVYRMAKVYINKARSVKSNILALDGVVFDATDPHHPQWKFDPVIPAGNNGGTYKIAFNQDGSLKSFTKQ
jgi:hypothetical protein